MSIHFTLSYKHFTFKFWSVMWKFMMLWLLYLCRSLFRSHLLLLMDYACPIISDNRLWSYTDCQPLTLYTQTVTVTVTTYSYPSPPNFSHKKDDMRYGSAAKNKPQVSGSMYDSFLRYVFFLCRSGIDDNVKRDLSMLFSGRRRLKTWLIWCLKSTSFVWLVL